MSADFRLLILKLSDTYVFETRKPDDPGGAASLCLAPVISSIEQALKEQIELTVKLLHQRLEQRRAQRIAPYSAASDPLFSLGRLLYTQLLPPEIQQFLQTIPSGAYLTLASNVSQLPWELAHDGLDYLALRCAVARQTLSARALRPVLPQTVRPWRALLICDPTGDLEGAEQEAYQLGDLITAVPGTAEVDLLMATRATRDQVLRRLASGDYDLIHFSGHASFDAARPEASALRLADNAPLAAVEIERSLGGNPFVFLNACASAKSSMTVEARAGGGLPNEAVQGLAAAFVHGGARDVIGTLWPIHDQKAHGFALTFYRAALRGEPVGQALRQARRAVWQQDSLDPQWASFSHYGDPTATLLAVHAVERHLATVLVLSWQDGHATRQLHPPDQSQTSFHASLATVAETLAHHRGQIQSIAYDTLIAAFGLSLPHQNEAECAIRAALAIVHPERLDANHSPGAQVSVGIATGEVHVREVGPTDHTLKVLEGRPVQDAVTLARQGLPGAVLVTDAVWRLTRHLVDGTPIGSSILGRHDGGRLYQINGLKAQPDPAVQALDRQLPIVGRERELEALAEIWRVCRQGEGQWVGIVGEAGVGKSRLLTEFRARVEDENVYCLYLRCPPTSTPQPYGLVAQMLYALLDLAPGQDREVLKEQLRDGFRRHLEGVLPALERSEDLTLVGNVLGLLDRDTSLDYLAAQARQRRLAGLIGRLLAQRAAPAPFLMVIDDLHWADDDSLEILNLLAHRPGRGCLVIVLFRPEAEERLAWWRRRGTTLLRLAPLDERASSHLVTGLLGDHPDATRLGDVVLGRAGGNPLFIHELVRALLEVDYSVGDPQVQGSMDATDEVPTTIQRVILARYAELPPPARRVLPLIVVAGDGATLSLLQNVMAETGEEAVLEEGLLQLEDRNLINLRWYDESYAFSHTLIQEVIYANLDADVRHRLHRRVGRVLEAALDGHEDSVLERLAYHYHHSDDRINACHYVLLAAQRARAVWAHAVAANWFTHMLAHLASFNHTPTSEAEVARGATPANLLAWHSEALEGRADVYTAMGRGEQAIADYHQLLDLTASTAEFPRTHRADVYRKLAIVCHDRGDLAAARTALDTGLEILDGLECLEAGRLWVWVGLLDFRSGRLHEALRACARGIALIAPTENSNDLAQAYNLQGVIYRNMGDSARAIPALEKSIALYRVSGHLPGLERAYHNLGCVYDDLGRWSEALEYFQHSADLSARTGEERRRLGAMISLGEIHRRRGDLDQAIRVYLAAHGLSEEFGFAEAVGLASMNLGACYLKQARLPEAHQSLDKAQGIFQRLAITVHEPELQCYLAEWSLQSLQLEEALTQAQVARDLAETLGRRIEQGQAERVLGKTYVALGQFDEAEAHLTASLSILTEQASPYEVALTKVDLARLRQAQSHTAPEPEAYLSGARQLCDHAIATFDRLGAAVDAAGARQLRQLL